MDFEILYFYYWKKCQRSQKKNYLLFNVTFTVCLVVIRDNQNLFIMKQFIIIFLFLTTPFLVFTQNYKEIFKVEFSEFNNKRLIVTQNQNNNYIFSSYNKEKQDIQNCNWKVELDKKKILKLTHEIESVIENKTKISEGYFYKIFRKKDKIKLIFKNSKCTSEHKLYYFQKDCNKEFTMKMSITEYKKLIFSLRHK